MEHRLRQSYTVFHLSMRSVAVIVLVIVLGSVFIVNIVAYMAAYRDFDVSHGVSRSYSMYY